MLKINFNKYITINVLTLLIVIVHCTGHNSDSSVIYNILHGNDIQLQNISTIKFESNLCASQYNDLIDSLIKNQDWAIEMLDAWGKIPLNLKSGTHYYLGEYDHCIQTIKANDGVSELLVGKYCTVQVTYRISQTQLQYSLTLGVCLPSGCDYNDVLQILNSILKRYNFLENFKPQIMQCNSKIDDKPFEPLTIVT